MISFPKGQIISKCLFGVFNFPPKNEQKQVNLEVSQYSKIEFVRSLLEEIDDPKNHFEIN